MSQLPVNNPAALVNTALTALSELAYNVNAIIMASAQTDVSTGVSLDFSLASTSGADWYTIALGMQSVLNRVSLKGVGVFTDADDSIYDFKIRYFNTYLNQRTITVGTLDLSYLLVPATFESDNDETRYQRIYQIQAQIQSLQEAYNAMA